MSKALVLGVAALALSAGAASAQVPGYDYNGATVPLYGYAAPAYGYGAPAPLYNYAAPPVYAAPPIYAVPAPLYGPGYDAPWDYAPGGREWMIEKGW
jgi:hypothetical protein